MRITNFTAEEEEVLLTIVQKYSHIVECKKTDHINNRRKLDVWLNIEKDFNSQSSLAHRTAEALRTKYKNIKKRSKKKFSDEKIYSSGTGGGPSRQVPITQTDNLVANILGTRMTGLKSVYDDDHDEEAIVEYEEIDVEPVASGPNEIEYVLHELKDEDVMNTKYTVPNEELTKGDVAIEKNCWNGQTVPLLRMPTSRPLQNNDTSNTTKRRKILQDGVSKWAQGKVALNSLKEELQKKEHENMQAMFKAEYEARLRREDHLAALQAREVEVRTENMKEKHILEMQYMKLQIKCKELEIQNQQH